MYRCTNCNKIQKRQPKLSTTVDELVNVPMAVVSRNSIWTERPEIAPSFHTETIRETFDIIICRKCIKKNSVRGIGRLSLNNRFFTTQLLLRRRRNIPWATSNSHSSSFNYMYSTSQSVSSQSFYFR